MALDLSAASLVRAGSGLLFVLVGVAMATLGRRRRENVAVGVAAVAFGLFFLVNNVFTLPFDVQFVLVLVAAAALAVPIASSRAAGAFALVTVAPLVGVMLLTPPLELAAAAPYPVPPPLADAYFRFVLGFFLLGAAVLAYSFLLALRVRRTPDARVRRASMLLASGWAMYVAYFVGDALTALAHLPSGSPALAYSWTGTLALSVVAVAATWLAASRNGGGTRNVAWLILAAVLAGMLDAAFLGGQFVSPWVGVVRSVGAALIAIAILREGALGFDLAIPTARRGTLATIGLVGFFAVAQIAQTYLSGTMGIVLGGVAAGVLLFAAAPLQRAAERLASGERESQSPTTGRDPGEHARHSYRLAVKAALADGSITREEDVHLADLAQHLGIGAGDAVRLRHEVERELEEAG